MTIFQSGLKEERPDEAEIRAWAAKILEYKNKQVTSNTNQVIPNSSGSRGTLLHYFPKLNGQTSSMPTTDTNIPSADEPSVAGRFCWKMVGKTFVPCVMKSDGTKYVAVRIAESKVLSHFLQRLNTEVFNCVSVKSFSITEAETKLLNEINTKHCEFHFGKEAFTMESDFIVKLQDLEEFYTFMETCFNKLTHAPSNGVQKCGFVRINDDSVVPYAVKNGQQYVPLFYFEGETESLKTKAINLENWDLAYLKFCCKVQGIKNELFASEQCQVTSLEDVKSYFPEGTKFDEYWPAKLIDMHTPTRNDVNGNHSWVQTPHVENVPQSTVPNASHPISKPMTVLQKQLHNNQRVSTTAVINNATTNVPMYQSNSWPSTLMGTTSNNVQPAPYQVTPQMASVAQPRLSQQKQNSTGNLHTMNANANITSRSYVSQAVRQQPCPPYYTNASNVPTVAGAAQPPPSLTRVTTANSVPNTYAAASAQNDTYSGHLFSGSTSLPAIYQNIGLNSSHAMTSGGPGAQMNKARNAPSSQGSQNASRFPPALTPITSTCVMPTNNGVPTNVITSGSRQQRAMPAAGFASNGGGGEIIDLSSPPHSPKNATNGPIRRPQMAGIAADYNRNNYKVFPPLVCVNEIPPPPKGQQPPFKAKNISFKDKHVLVMNLKPYHYDDYVMTLPDVISHFFPRVDLNRIRHVLQNVFKITLYKGNMLQMQVLKENQKCKSIDEEMPLVLLNDLEIYYAQLGYVEAMLNSTSDRDNIERDAKRQKVS